MSGLDEKIIDDLKHCQCLKQVTVAVIMKDQKLLSIGHNHMMFNPGECPRDKKGCKSGEGYSLCKEVCRQSGHAEINAIENCSKDIEGATLYLIGHTYACDNCMEAMKKAKLLRLVICDTGVVLPICLKFKKDNLSGKKE